MPYGQSAMVYISSKFKNVGETSSNFTVNLNPAINDAQSVDIVSAEIPHTWTSFDRFNNAIFYRKSTSSGIARVAYIDTNRYFFNGTDLATHITELFAADNDQSTVITCAFVEETLSLKLTSTGGNFILEGGEWSANPYLGWEGFYAGEYTNSFLPTDTFTLQRTNAVYLRCSAIYGQAQGNMPGSDQTLLKIGVNTNTGGIITYYDVSDVNTIPLSNRFIQNMQFTLVGDEGEILDLKGRDISFQLRFMY